MNLWTIKKVCGRSGKNTRLEMEKEITLRLQKHIEKLKEPVAVIGKMLREGKRHC